MSDLTDSSFREGEPPIVPPSGQALESRPNYWLLVIGPVFGAVAGLSLGYFAYGGLSGGRGGYYGEIRVFFEYLWTGLLVGFLLGLVLGLWMGLKVCRRSSHRS